MAAEGTGGNGKAIMIFTLNGNGGPTGADHGGFFPSTAYGRLTATSLGLTGSTINIADLGQSPQDGFTEYGPFPAPGIPPGPAGAITAGRSTSPDGSDRLYFANQLHPVPQLHRQRVHADDRNVRRNPGRFRQLGNLGQLRRAVALQAAGRGPRRRSAPRSRPN